MDSKVYRPNTNNACPAATAITCRPSTINEIGADLVYPPSETRQTSRPVSASTAKQTPPDAPNTSPPSVESRPLYSAPEGAVNFHFGRPVAASSAMTWWIAGSRVKPLPKYWTFSLRVTLSGGSFVKTELLSSAGTNIDPRF